MFKKLFPLIVILALLAAYAGYRAVDAQSAASGAAKVAAPSSQAAEASFPDAGSSRRITSWTNLSAGDLERARYYAGLEQSGGDCRPQAPPWHRANVTAPC